MNVSDFLTLIGILFATFSLISEKNREYVLLKFTKLEFGFILLFVLYIHYLLSYDWWCEKIPNLRYFELKGFPTNSAWSYILCIIFLAYIVIKISVTKPPLSRREKLLSYYNKLLQTGDFSSLIQLIKQHHFEEIIRYLSTQNEQEKRSKVTSSGSSVGDHDTTLGNIRVTATEDGFIINETINATVPTLNDNDELKKQVKYDYGELIYTHVILKDAFVENVSQIDPYFFASIIANLKYKNSTNSEFLNSFLKSLSVGEKRTLFRELKMIESEGFHGNYIIERDCEILWALFSDISVCSLNEAWRGIAEPAIVEMQEEAQKVYSPLRLEENEQGKDTLWSYKMTMAIKYFDIMVREAIVQKAEDSMWMFYYSHFCSVILSNMNDDAQNRANNRESRNFDLIEKIFENLTAWVAIVGKSKSVSLLEAIFDCIGSCIVQIAQTTKLTSEHKLDLIKPIWNHLMELNTENGEMEEINTKILNAGFDMFKEPSITFSSDQDKNSYICLIMAMSQQRDIFLNLGNGSRAKNTREFDEKVIKVLKKI